MGNATEGMIVLYQTEDGQVAVHVRFEEETFWLTQKAIAELFDTTVPNINIHIKNVLEEEELKEAETIKDFLIVQTEGKRQVNRKVRFYNLDMIIAVDKAEGIYRRFRIEQDERYISEFDRDMMRYLKGGKDDE